MIGSTIMKRVRGGPTRILVAAITTVFLVGVIFGFLGGYKFGEGKSPGKKTAAAGKAGSRAGAATGPVLLVGGQLTAVRSNAIEVRIAGKLHPIALQPTTPILATAPGSAADIAPGAYVWWNPATGFTDAKEIIVLPANPNIVSYPVTAVAPGSMTVQNGTTTPVVAITGATVNKAAPSSIAALQTGARILVAYRANKKKHLRAAEIIVLPSTTTF